MSPAGRHFYDDEDRVNPIYRDYPYPNHHTNPDGLRVYDRHRKAGYSGYIADGENILYYSNSNLAKMSKQKVVLKIICGIHGWGNSLHTEPICFHLNSTEKA